MNWDEIAQLFLMAQGIACGYCLVRGTLLAHWCKRLEVRG